ncbi:MAG: uracil-DNA glycosylase, partial [candidate division Zixibacteria bacterium]|nr:uracil-DNA glycosylase [candidate division Zixibacteria bacterium]
MSSVRKVSQTADMFDPAVTVSTTPQYASLEDHFNAMCDCQRCSLGQTRNKLVYGAGNPKADVIFVGEGPGADEDRIGEPFVGRAGQLLDRILAAIQLSREQVYIGNIVKCRPPNNRDPLPEEMESCFP